MQLGPVPHAAVDRFRDSLSGIISPEEFENARVGVAVSGGPDSLAMLLLIAAALPGRVLAATVDHGLRSESAAEAEHVAWLCGQISVPHHIETLEWPSEPQSNRQAISREARYARLGMWALDAGISFVATAHHLDDQAETLMMRLNRGAGVGGLAGIRSRRLMISKGEQQVDLIRPVLAWRRHELEEIVESCGLQPVLDPSNSDPQYDRTRARAFLKSSPDWPDRQRMADSARYLADADRALDWAAVGLFTERHKWDGSAYEIVLGDLPSELKRRVMLETIRMMVGNEPDGPTLTRAISTLQAGQVATLADVVIRPRGGAWRFEWAPPRRK